jgi:hypothetical protein
VSFEALLLALTAVVRPTSAAAVVAILKTKRPQQLLTAYLVAGLAFSIGVGVLVVVLLRGLASSSAGAPARPAIDFVLGGCALLYGGAVWIGWLPRERISKSPDSGGESWMRRMLQDLSTWTAATAGVLTHLPGLVYLAALNLIVASSASAFNGLIQVVIYNAIWFSLAIAALVLSRYRPGRTEELLELAGAWVRKNRRLITVVLCLVLGCYLVITGVFDVLNLPQQ